MKKPYSIILGLSYIFLACSCFPESKSSKSSDTSSSSSTSTTHKTSDSSEPAVDYSSNPYIGSSGSLYSRTANGTTMSYSFNPNGTGVWTTTQAEINDIKQFTYTIVDPLKSNSVVEFVLAGSSDKNVGNFTTDQNGQAFVVLSLYFYRT